MPDRAAIVTGTLRHQSALYAEPLSDPGNCRTKVAAFRFAGSGPSDSASFIRYTMIMNTASLIFHTGPLEHIV